MRKILNRNMQAYQNTNVRVAVTLRSKLNKT